MRPRRGASRCIGLGASTLRYESKQEQANKVSKYRYSEQTQKYLIQADTDLTRWPHNISHDFSTCLCGAVYGVRPWVTAYILADLWGTSASLSSMPFVGCCGRHGRRRRACEERITNFEAPQNRT